MSDWRASVVKVEFEEGGHGTGFVVGPVLVMTALHVVVPGYKKSQREVRTLIITNEGTRLGRAALKWPYPYSIQDASPDVAVLEVELEHEARLPQAVRLSGLCGDGGVGFQCWGFPEGVANGGKEVTGTLTRRGTSDLLVVALNVMSPPPRGNPIWKGISGAPVVVANRVVAIASRDDQDPRILEAVKLGLVLADPDLRRLLPKDVECQSLPRVVARFWDNREARGAFEIELRHGAREILRLQDGSHSALSSAPASHSVGDSACKAHLQAHVRALSDKYRWLELQGIREAGALRIELEKVYLALKAEPKSEYDRQQAANLHSVEVREAAGVDSFDMIDPAMLEHYDAAVIRLTSRPAREEAKRATVTEVQTLGDAFRHHRRMVLLGGPGSGKTTLGRWLVLKLAHGLSQHYEFEVAPEQREASPTDIRVAIAANATFAFSGRHFFGLDGPSGDINQVRIEALPTRGVLMVAGTPVRSGIVIDPKQINELTYTPAANEAGTCYASFRFATGSGEEFHAPVTAVIDVRVHVRVPESEIDPKHPLGSDLVDLGPARLPIFLRLAHFARELAEREREQRPTVALLDYLGHDPDSCGLGDEITPDARNALVRSCLRDGRGVIILDGLDELPEGSRRTVVLKIQDFIEKAPFLDGAAAGVAPWEGGGNQVVVTSRYVGYELAPVQSGCVHLGIQPMQRQAVERFARSWTDAVNVVLANEGAAGVVAERLIAEIYNDARPKLRELATNPLLVTILATVYWRDGRLPDQRAGVYDRVVESLLEIWLKREECRGRLTRLQLLTALQPLAADMQESASNNGLVSLDRIEEVVEGPLARLQNMEPDDPRFAAVRDALLGTIRKHVGLLAEQSSGNYSFFHRTFQEFLAARHLLAHQPTAAKKIGDLIDDSLWREPLLLALGFAMIDRAWGPEKRIRLLTDVLETDGPQALIPRAALLLVTALPELQDAPAAVVSQIAVRLLTSYAISQDQGQAGVLREQIEQAFVRLRDGRQADSVARQLAESIRRPTDGRDLAGAAAAILRRIDWFNTELVEGLLLAVRRDRGDLDWPVHRALHAALGYRPDARPWLSSAAAPNVARLLGTHLPMRNLLEGAPDLVGLVRGDADWLCLLVALYGGIGHLQLLERLDQYQQQRVQAARSAAINAAVFVNLEPKPDPPPPSPAVAFSPQDIVHDLEDDALSRLIQRHLSARGQARRLADAFLRRWETGGSSAGAAEALIGLAALGEDVFPLLRAGLNRPERQAAAQAALARFGWLRAMLREPLLRATELAARTIPEAAPEQHQLDLLRVAQNARMASGGSPLPISDKIPEFRHVAGATPAVRDALEAEYWSYLFSGTAGDEGGHFTSIADRLTQPLDRLIHSWSLLAEARNRRAARRLPWPQPPLAPRADSPVERYLAMLDAVASVPREFGRAAGYALGRCRPFLEDHPALAWETLALCWANGMEFSRGYRLAARGGPIGGFPMPDEPSEEPPRLFPGSALFLRLSGIADPYIRFRAEWRFVGAIVGENEALGGDPLGMVERIIDPHDQVRAFEWILMTLPPAAVGLLNHIGLLDPMVRTVSLITDNENRARAQCRLAFLAAEHLEKLLRDAVESVRCIGDLGRRAETIGEIRAAWGRTAGVAEALDTVALEIPDAWGRDKALGRASRLVQAYRHQYPAKALAWRLPPDAASGAPTFRRPHPSGPLPWTLVYLDATAAEAEPLAATPVGEGANWDRLLGAERLAAVAALSVVGAVGSLPVTAREASILDRVVQADHVADLDGLWPHLDRPDPGAMGTIARWSARRDRAGQWSALVQAEGGRLNPEVVASVIELLAGSTDRLKLRAALALHGPTPYDQNPQRRWSVRHVGADTVDVLARCAAQGSQSPAVQTSLNWTLSDIHHDDPAALHRWVEQAESDGQFSPAAWLLGTLQSVQGDLVPLLLSALHSKSPDLQRPLLRGLAVLAHCSEAFRNSQDIITAVAAVPQEVRASLCVPAAGPETVLKVAKEIVGAAQPGDQLSQARRLLESQLLWLDDSCLSGTKCAERLKAIGDQLFIPIGNLGAGSYWSKVDKAAVPLAENVEALRLLLSWLALANVTADASGYAHHLLTATEAVARLSPDAFAAVAEPEFWEPVLTDWVQFGEHWTARMAAVRLLGMLRRVTERTARALRAAMNDVSFVQHAAYSSVSEFRRIEGDILPELIQLLDDPSAGVVAASTRLLVAVARAGVAPAVRRSILRGLQQAVTRPSMARPVYLMHEGNGLMSIRFVDRLDRNLYGAIFEISGL